jgi:dolichol-phosphate mannosyltransferase
MNKLIFDKKWELPEFEIYEFKKPCKKYCIGIPVVNEGEKFKKQLKSMQDFSKIADILIFDWGSIDGSTEPKFLKSCGVKALLVKKSFGKQGTQLRMGFAYALKCNYQGIITIDGNGKDGVSAIPNFIKALEEGYDYIQGSRFIKNGRAINTPKLRLFGIRFILSPLLSIAARYWYTDITNGFRGYSRRFLTHPQVKPFRNIFYSYDLLFYLTVRANQLSLKTKEIPVLRKYPPGKIPTKITGFKGYFDLIRTSMKVALGHYNPQA